MVIIGYHPKGDRTWVNGEYQEDAPRFEFVSAKQGFIKRLLEDAQVMRTTLDIEVRDGMARRLMRAELRSLDNVV